MTTTNEQSTLTEFKVNYWDRYGLMISVPDSIYAMLPQDTTIFAHNFTIKARIELNYSVARRKDVCSIKFHATFINPVNINKHKMIKFKKKKNDMANSKNRFCVVYMYKEVVISDKGGDRLFSAAQLQKPYLKYFHPGRAIIYPGPDLNVFSKNLYMLNLVAFIKENKNV